MTDTKKAPQTKFDKARERAAELGGKKPEKPAETVQDVQVETAKPQEEITASVQEQEKQAATKSPEKPKTEDKPAEVPNTEDKAIEEVKPAEIVNNQIIFTPKHMELIKNQIAPNASPEEFDLFIMMARRTRLDPLLKQLYFIKYGNNPASYVTSIDSYRIIAHRTGAFAGVDLPEYTYDKNGKVTHAAITVYKLVEGQRFGFSAKVKFTEYTTGKNQWASKPETMIAKVAEAHALRKAFPQDLNGVYTTDEMEQAGVVVDGKTGHVVERQAPEMITKAQVVKVKELMEQKGVDIDRLKGVVSRDYKRKSMADLTKKQAGHLIGRMQKLPDAVVDEPEQESYDDGEVIPDNDSFEAFAESEMSKGEAMPNNDLDLDEIDEGIEAMRNA